MHTMTVRGIARRVCSECRTIHYADPKVAVGVAVFRDDALLLVRRTMDPGRGRWALPGGFVDAGEDPRAAAAREAKEEAGVTVEVGDVVDVYANPPEDGGALFVLYGATWVEGEPQPGDDADATRFFHRDELPPLAFSSTSAAVARWPQPATPPHDAAQQRRLAVAAFNRAWDLIDLDDRSDEQARDMFATACASRALWSDIGSDENLAVADWQVAHAASLIGWADVALEFAAAAERRARSASLPVWLQASTCEGLARAHAVAGDEAGYRRWRDQAERLLADVDNDDDRTVVEEQLASIPAPGRTARAEA
jgi:8-oxo-dGTP diphosphatase